VPKANHWSHRDHTRLAELFALGKTYAEIAAIIERSERSVANKCHEIGLRHYKRNTRRADSVEARQLDVAVECLDLLRTLGEAEGWRDVVTEVDAALQKIERVGRRSTSSRSPSPSPSPLP